jgi:hypothetical protein
MTCIASGLTYTFDIHTPAAKWIGYQALAGLGLGLNNQIPLVATQAAVTAADLSSITALMIFFQTFTGAIFSAAAQSVFTNKAVKVLPTFLPDVNPRLVIAAGATEFRKSFPPEMIPGIVASYMEGLQDVFLVGLGAATAAFLMTIIITVFDQRKLNSGLNAAAAMA